jgi:hypothetical protein
MTDQVRSDSGEDARYAWIMFVRPSLSWIVACVFSSAIWYGMMLMLTRSLYPSYSPPLEDLLNEFGIIMWFVARTSVVPWLIIVVLLRTFKWRRGLLDAVFAGLAPVLLYRLWIDVEDYLIVLTRRDVTVLEFVLFAAGAMGGITYWFAAGRPRPPY